MPKFAGLGIGQLLAIVGLLLTIVFIAVSQLSILPVGLLFILAFAAILL
jgi:hypothetical protein